jgi:hypothetical protein
MRRNKSELNQTLVELQNTITSAKEEIVAAVAELREFVRVLNDDQAAAADRRFSGFPDVVGLSVLAAINDANDRVVAEVAESRELIIKTLPVGK